MKGYALLLFLFSCLLSISTPAWNVHGRRNRLSCNGIRSLRSVESLLAPCSCGVRGCSWFARSGGRHAFIDNRLTLCRQVGDAFSTAFLGRRAFFFVCPCCYNLSRPGRFKRESEVGGSPPAGCFSSRVNFDAVATSGRAGEGACGTWAFVPADCRGGRRCSWLSFGDREWSALADSVADVLA